MKEIYQNDDQLIRALKILVLATVIAELVIGALGWFMGTHLYFFGLGTTCISALFLNIFHGVKTVGTKNVILIMIIGMVGSLFFEAMGVNFGLFFSRYTYTGYIPGPKIFGFDVLSMIGYGFAVYEIWTLAQAAVGMFDNRFRRGDVILVPAVGALLFVSIDYATDPLLATITGAYDWVQPGVYYGVPYQNYLGWIVMAFCIMLSISLLLYFQQKKGTLPEAPTVARRKWFWTTPALIYGALYLQMPFYALIRQNQEVTTYSGQSFMTHDIYWGVAIIYLGAILAPALIIWARIHRDPQLED